MGLLNFFGRRPAPDEARASTGVQVAQSDPDILRIFGLTAGGVAGEVVTVDTALGVPAIWSAVNFLAGTVAGLPLKVYRRTAGGSEVASNHPLSDILNEVSNAQDLQSSFDFRKWLLEQTLTGGRGLAFIERSPSGNVLDLWPLDPATVTVRRGGRKKTYEVRESGRPAVIYDASDVIDIPFMLRADGLQHRSPIHSNKRVIGLAQAVTNWGAKFFENGGVPPFAVTGKFQSGASMGRAADDLDGAVRKAAKDQRQALVLPDGLEIKPLGSTAEDAQMIETQRFVIEQMARIYSLPPVFLQDLTHGTYSNTEQQDLHLVKHTVKRWVEQIEQEMTMKFFGRGSGFYVEHALDGLLRGDFKARMEGYSRAIQSGVMMPDEARALENRPSAEGGNQLFIQGATVPLTMAGKVQAPPVSAGAPGAGTKAGSADDEM